MQFWKLRICGQKPVWSFRCVTWRKSPSLWVDNRFDTKPAWLSLFLAYYARLCTDLFLCLFWRGSRPTSETWWWAGAFSPFDWLHSILVLFPSSLDFQLTFIYVPLCFWIDNSWQAVCWPKWHHFHKVPYICNYVIFSSICTFLPIFCVSGPRLLSRPSLLFISLLHIVLWAWSSFWSQFLTQSHVWLPFA